MLRLLDNLSEIYHWLPVTTSKKLANKIHFGTFSNSNVTNETIYDGKGAEAQNLFTIYYIIPISLATIIFGPLADQLNKRLEIWVICESKTQKSGYSLVHHF